MRPPVLMERRELAEHSLGLGGGQSAREACVCTAGRLDGFGLAGRSTKFLPES